jgi:hypothetical protein
MSMRRSVDPGVVDIAKSHFRRGAEIVYLWVDVDGSVHVTAYPPEESVFVAARSIEQIERFVTELRRQSA